ncbi:DUF5723 family protein [Flammeovirga pacifica]|uniref:DUF5723 domain-containing protein n=1 Tax=Flammeovirga pacifica TaxID=915059 RepID=A0A1S1YXT8_FLAPC|nr:DUF5723 family protein [Flammeovirga pacifica]OHX65821.1 hypothetical protein NH26_05380 [Flammeovirga pacifica]
MKHQKAYHLLIIFLFLIFSPLVLKAQEESILYFMNDMPQRQHLNPAHKSVYKTTFVLPSMYANNNSIILPFDVIIDGGEFPGNFDLSKILSELNKLEQEEDHAVLDIAGIYITNDKVGISFFAREKATFLSYDHKISTPTNFSNSQTESKVLDINHYREYGIGFNYNIKDRLTLGFNAKYLQGLDNLKVSGSELDSTQNTNQGIVSYESGKNGHGYALDFGASYQITDHWMIDIAVTNLGQIHWGDTYQYTEIDDLYPVSNNDDSNIVESNENFTTFLPMQFVLGGSYNFGHKFLIGATVGGGYYRDILNLKYSVNMHKRFADFLGLGINYTNEGTGVEKIGASASIGFPGIKAYAITENVFGVVEQWDSDRSLMVRIGVNLNFGYVKQNYLNKKETRASKIMEATW